jgi:hypothetical protein
MFWEWITASVVGFAIAGIYHWMVIKGMTDDVETLSGRVVEAHDYKPWTEYYEYAVYRTETRHGTRTVSDGKGRSHTESYTYTVEVFDHWSPSMRFHSESWGYTDSFGSDGGIDEATYKDIVARFGGERETPGRRTTSDHNSHMISGDPNDRVSVNKNNFVKPVTRWHHWENKVKSAPTVFSFEKVPPEAPVFEYPKNDNVFASDRLLGTAGTIPLLAWDQMNARLGPTKKVNVIAVGFGTQSSQIAELQRSKWIGGKKNDLVICYGGPSPTKATWAQCFGWTDEALCKRNLETIFISTPINAEIVPKVEAEIAARYKIKNWSEFDYLTVEPPTWSYWVFFAIIGVVQGGMWLFFMNNDMDKENTTKITGGSSTDSTSETSGSTRVYGALGVYTDLAPTEQDENSS